MRACDCGRRSVLYQLAEPGMAVFLLPPCPSGVPDTLIVFRAYNHFPHVFLEVCCPHLHNCHLVYFYFLVKTVFLVLNGLFNYLAKFGILCFSRNFINFV